VLLNTLTGRRTLELDKDVIRYQEASERVKAVALPKTESLSVIHRLASEL
jgi:hypothetical protein